MILYVFLSRWNAESFLGTSIEYLKPFGRKRESCPLIQLLLYEVGGNFVFGFWEETICICYSD